MTAPKLARIERWHFFRCCGRLFNFVAKVCPGGCGLCSMCCTGQLTGCVGNYKPQEGTGVKA